MTLNEIVEIADKVYPDSMIDQNFDKRTQSLAAASKGDSLARFIVSELVETYAKDATDHVQASQALRVMEKAVQELTAVRDAFRPAVSH
ncbi:MAG TPA: hypothetical protein VGP72_06835 [Planctomycetota bacterium]|jgi:hypothetical protein